MTDMDRMTGYINRIKYCQKYFEGLPYQFAFDYGLKDMCTNAVTEESIKVGNGASTDYDSAECKEISLDNIPGECITEVVFYRK